MMTQKRLLSWVVLLVLFGTALSFSAETELGAPIATSGEGKLYQVGDIRVAVLQGTYYEMGQQYGALLADDIETASGMISQAFKHLGQERAENGKKLVQLQLDYYPKRFHDLIRGIADGSGLSVEEVAFVDHAISFMAALTRGVFCSSVTTWGDYTTDGQLIMGRNFDYPVLYKKFASHLCLVVFNPIDGCVPTALFGYAGQINSVQAFNSAGLVLELNVAIGLSGPDNDVHPDRITMPLLLTQLAFDSMTMAQLDAGLKTMRTNYPLLNTVADVNTACTYEMGTRDTVKREIDCDGLNTVSNFPSDPHWGKIMLGDNRRKNLQTLANRNKGKIDFATMKEIIGTKEKEGGAMVESEIIIATLYQFVFEPKTKRVAFRLPDLTKNWTEIDLNQFFAE